MKQENVLYFTDKEEEVVDLLIEVGIAKNIAKVLVFLANTPEATSRAIERGIDMNQPEVSVAMQTLMGQGWVKSRDGSPDSKGKRKGRPMKIYELAKPINDIISCIEDEKKTHAMNQIALLKKVRAHIS
jgi:predicted transcriptional regulator